MLNNCLHISADKGIFVTNVNQKTSGHANWDALAHIGTEMKRNFKGLNRRNTLMEESDWSKQ